MSKYKLGDKFVIEIGTILGGGGKYLIKGFNTLCFDDNGLDRIDRYSAEDVWRAGYKTGYDKGYAEGIAKKDEIKVGDEVRLKDLGLMGVVTRLADLERAACIMFDDGSATWKSVNGAKKTGRHFPIEDILEQMRGE